MNKISEFNICVYRNNVVFELTNADGIEPEAHEMLIDRLYDIIQNDFADNIREKFDEALTNEHCHNSQRMGGF